MTADDHDSTPTADADSVDPPAAAASESPGFKVTDKRASAHAEAGTEADASDAADGADDDAQAARAEALRDRLTRVHADFANFRRRAELEAQELAKFANQAFALDLLRVADGIERAFRALPSSMRGITWIDGIALVHAQLRGVLEAQSVIAIECELGKPVDISTQEVVVTDEGDGPLVVLEELQRGYRMHDRVIRPTQVRIGPPPPESEPADAESADEDGAADRADATERPSDAG